MNKPKPKRPNMRKKHPPIKFKELEEIVKRIVRLPFKPTKN